MRNMHAILVGLFSVPHTPEQADHAARSVLEQHAHELAALQRLRMDELDLTGQKARIVGRIIDLIDPEASDG